MTGREIYAPRQARQRRSWTLAAIVLLLVFSFGGQILAAIAGVLLGLINAQTGEMDWVGMSYILIAAFGATAILLLLWTTFFERRGPATIGLNARFALRFARGYGLGLGFLAGVVALIWGLGGYQIEASGSLAVASLIPVAWLLAGFIVQGSTEELLFRGWLMSLIASRHGIWLAIVINSALFGLMHAGNIAWSQELMFGLANIVLVGVFLSLYAAKEGSLWGVCGWHAAWNWLLASGFGLPVSGQDVLVTPIIIDLADTPDAAWWLTGGVFGPEASVVTTVVLASGVLVLLLRGKFASFGVAGAAALAAKAPPTTGGATGASGPKHYDEELGPILFAGYAADIVKRAAALSPGNVLELAAGTGIVSRRLRDSLAPETSLLVSDLSAPMLVIAKTKFEPGESVEFHLADAMSLPFESASVDQVVCQFGAMYFPEKVAAFAEVRRVLSDGGSLVFNVWGTLERNPCAEIAQATVEAIYPDDPPGFFRVPYAYSDPNQVRADLEAAGFADISQDTVRIDAKVADWGLLARGLVLGSPLIEEVRARGTVAEEAVVERFTLALRERFGGEPGHMPLEAHVFSAHKPRQESSIRSEPPVSAAAPKPGASTAFIGNIPQNYDEGLGPHIFTDYAADLAARAAALDAGDVLELAAGTGIVSRQLRDALPAEARLVVTDLNPPMLDIARSKFEPGEVVEFRQADAMALPFDDNSFDAIISQFGVMFFPDKVEAFRESRRALRPGGHILFNVWGEMEANPFSLVGHETAAEIFPDNPPVFYRYPFSYADPALVTADLEAAGFVDIAHEIVSIDKRVDDWALFGRGLVLGNPLVDEIRQRGTISAEAVIERFTLALRTRFGIEPARMPLEAVVFSARKPD